MTQQDTDSATDQVLDFNGQNIEDWGLVIEVIETKLPNLRELNLCNNYLRDVPDELHQACPELELLNLNNNPLTQEQFE